MKITGKHPNKINDPLLKHPAMKNRRWQIDPTAEPHTSFKKLSKKQIDEFGVDNMDTYTDTKNNDVDISYREFYDDLKNTNELVSNPVDSTASHHIDPIEFSLGQTIEMEHTHDPNIAAKIALDHLKEDPKYYTKLKAAGLAKELDQLSSSTGFGDPNHTINHEKRIGVPNSDNFGGKIGNTPNAHIDSKSTDYAVDIDIQEPSLTETKKKKKKDRCHKKADSVYGHETSAYKSGAIVKCRQGKIWKKKQEESIELEEKENLHKWFSRRGGEGGKGWVDCNTCRNDPETGTKKCKSCGRQAGEKRAKYPACRPTPSQCNTTGTRRKKGPQRISWKKKEESIKYKDFFKNLNNSSAD